MGRGQPEKAGQTPGLATGLRLHRALPALSDWYESQIPFYSYRHIVRPGITGWALVNQGNVAMIKAATTKLHFDFYYIKHFSPWIELLIAARTVRIVLTGFGSR